MALPVCAPPAIKSIVRPTSERPGRDGLSRQTYRTTCPIDVGPRWHCGDLAAAPVRGRRTSDGSPQSCRLDPRPRRSCRGSMAQGRRSTELAMLFDILVNLPSLVLYEIAWCIRFAVALSCLVMRSEEHTSELQSHSFISYA